MFELITIQSDRFMLTKNFVSLAEFWKRKDGTLTVNYTDDFQNLSIEEQIICNLQINREFKAVKKTDSPASKNQSEVKY